MINLYLFGFMIDLISLLKDCREHLADAHCSLTSKGNSCPNALRPLYSEIYSLMESVEDVIVRLESLPNPSSD